MAPYRSQETRSLSGLMRTFNRFKATASHIKNKTFLPFLLPIISCYHKCLILNLGTINIILKKCIPFNNYTEQIHLLRN